MPNKFIYILQGIHKSYTVGNIQVVALQKIDLHIPSGEFLALQGPSGSGKSTLLNLLGLIESQSQGKILFDDVDTSKLTDATLTEQRRHSIGFIFQNFSLIPILTAQENVEYPLLLERKLTASDIHIKAEDALNKVGLLKFAKHRPRELSGGQRQRVAIARAIIKHPKVILADEPTANLDSKTGSKIMETFQEIRDSFKVSLIIATHDESIARMADRKIHLQDGSLI